MTRVLIAEPVPATAVAHLQSRLPEGVICEAVPTLSDDDFLAALGTADVLLVTFRKIDARVFDLAPHLRFVQRCGVGYDNIDIAAAAAAGVAVSYMPGVNASAVAEHTILLMLALLKQFSASEEAARGGQWWTLDEIARRDLGDLAGASVGLIGFGNIGQAVARRLRAFGASVRYTKRIRANESLESELGVLYADLPELLSASSIVSLHLPSSPDSHSLIGKPQFAMMPPGSYLINTSRGRLVDEMALRQAIVSGHLAGAGLDVLEEESAGGNPFTDLPQVIVTTHVAGTTRGTMVRIMEIAGDNIARFVAGQPPFHLVPPG